MQRGWFIDWPSLMENQVNIYSRGTPEIKALKKENHKTHTVNVGCKDIAKPN